jgi:8-oxo-dGTP pyrophosphatase MutT (NUDIX family)
MSQDGVIPSPESPSSSASSSDLKANVAADESLRATSMSTECLAALCFAPFPNSSNAAAATPPTLNISVPPSTRLHEPVPVSSASSTCTRESDTGVYSDAECGSLLLAAGSGTGASHPNSSSNNTAATPSSAQPRVFYRQVSERLNAKVASRKTSRQGRAGQRWTQHEEGIVRLVTGAVPILRGGKIMFVSSRKRPDWIIPKGGWEKDEAMEESAIREVFEEAGVIGVLGPRLTEVQYETRKAKKRRLQQETVEGHDEASKRPRSQPSSPEAEPAPSTAAALLSPQDVERIPGQETEAKRGGEAVSSSATTPPPRQSHATTADDKSSVASATSQHTQVRMMLYPLYVQKVFDEWPESGRVRMAVDIDTAIQMLGQRPELQAALKEVKERGLHLIPAADGLT